MLCWVAFAFRLVNCAASLAISNRSPPSDPANTQGQTIRAGCIGVATLEELSVERELPPENPAGPDIFELLKLIEAIESRPVLSRDASLRWH
jgi:hypothetical protein